MTTFEVFPPKGNKPLLTFDNQADALRYIEERGHVVPGLRLDKVVRYERREAVSLLRAVA